MYKDWFILILLIQYKKETVAMVKIIKVFREPVPAMRFIGKKYPGFGGKLSVSEIHHSGR